MNTAQSILYSTREVTKAISKGRKLFDATTISNNHKKQKERIDSDISISTRFNLFSSRVLTLYASICGNNDSAKVFQALFETCHFLLKFLPSIPIDAVL